MEVYNFGSSTFVPILSIASSSTYHSVVILLPENWDFIMTVHTDNPICALEYPHRPRHHATALFVAQLTRMARDLTACTVHVTPSASRHVQARQSHGGLERRRLCGQGRSVVAMRVGPRWHDRRSASDSTSPMIATDALCMRATPSSPRKAYSRTSFSRM